MGLFNFFCYKITSELPQTIKFKDFDPQRYFPLTTTFLYKSDGSKYNLNPDEILFNQKLLSALNAVSKKELYNISLKGDGVLNYEVNRMQLGRVKLRGKTFSIQILTNIDCKWEPISSVNDAVKYIPKWISYVKYLLA